MIRPPALTSIIHQPIILSRAYMARACRERYPAVQCFVARSAYWITMNPLTTRRKALKVALRPLPLSTASREKVSPLYATRCEESSEFQQDLSRLIPARWIANIRECCTAQFTCDHRCNDSTVRLTQVHILSMRMINVVCTVL